MAALGGKLPFSVYAFTMKEAASWTVLVLAFAASGCSSSSETRIAPGCYYDDRGVAVLNVAGTSARFLIPSEVPEIELSPSGARPAFYLVEGPGGDRIVANDALREVQLPIGTNPATIGIPDAPDGYLTVTLGKPCTG
jgi:hypothetical protein